MSGNIDSKINFWNKRLEGLIKEKYQTQVSFLKAFQARYHAGTQADVSRWCRVGKSVKGRNGKLTKIGFPSFETMNRIAEFFDVDIGYLIGETEYDTFEMEKACTALHIDKSAGKALRGIATGDKLGLAGMLYADQYQATLKYLITSDSFLPLVEGLRNLAVIKHETLYPKNCLADAIQKVDPDILNLARECCDYGAGEEPSDRVKEFLSQYPEREQELRDAVFALSEGADIDFAESEKNSLSLKLAEYDLQKAYFKLIDEVTAAEHLEEMSYTSVVPIKFD